MIASVTIATSVACGENVPARGRERDHARPELAGHDLQVEAEEVAQLGAGDEDGDAVREADDDRARDEADGDAHAGEPHDDQHDAGHHRAHEQAVDAVLRDDAGDDDDERAGRPGNLHARTAQRRDDEAGDDGAVDAGLWRQAGGDRERHGERQRHQADGDAGGHVGGGGTPVVRAQAGDETGSQRGGRWHTPSIYEYIYIWDAPAAHAGVPAPAKRA